MGRRQEVPAAFTAVHDDYTAALERAPLDAGTRRAYASRVRAFLAWLDAVRLPAEFLDWAYDTFARSLLLRTSCDHAAHRRGARLRYFTSAAGKCFGVAGPLRHLREHPWQSITVVRGSFPLRPRIPLPAPGDLA